MYLNLWQKISLYSRYPLSKLVSFFLLFFSLECLFLPYLIGILLLMHWDLKNVFPPLGILPRHLFKTELISQLCSHNILSHFLFTYLVAFSICLPVIMKTVSIPYPNVLTSQHRIFKLFVSGTLLIALRWWLALTLIWSHLIFLSFNWRVQYFGSSWFSGLAFVLNVI